MHRQTTYSSVVGPVYQPWYRRPWSYFSTWGRPVGAGTLTTPWATYTAPWFVRALIGLLVLAVVFSSIFFPIYYEYPVTTTTWVVHEDTYWV